VYTFSCTSRGRVSALVNHVQIWGTGISLCLLLALILGRASFGTYWWKCLWGILVVPVAYFVWLLAYISRCLLSLWLFDFVRCIGAMFGLAAASWLGFWYVLVPNGGCNVVGLSSVYARAIAMLFLGYWCILMIIPYIQSKMCKWRQNTVSSFVQIILQIVAPFLVWWAKPELYLVYFVRLNSERSYTIQFSTWEQGLFTGFVVLIFSLLFHCLRRRPEFDRASPRGRNFSH